MYYYNYLLVELKSKKGWYCWYYYYCCCWYTLNCTVAEATGQKTLYIEMNKADTIGYIVVYASRQTTMDTVGPVAANTNTSYSNTEAICYSSETIPQNVPEDG